MRNVTIIIIVIVSIFVISCQGTDPVSDEQDTAYASSDTSVEGTTYTQDQMEDYWNQYNDLESELVALNAVEEVYSNQLNNLRSDFAVVARQACDELNNCTYQDKYFDQTENLSAVVTYAAQNSYCEYAGSEETFGTVSPNADGTYTLTQEERSEYWTDFRNLENEVVTARNSADAAKDQLNTLRVAFAAVSATLCEFLEECTYYDKYSSIEEAIYVSEENLNSYCLTL